MFRQPHLSAFYTLPKPNDFGRLNVREKPAEESVVARSGPREVVPYPDITSGLLTAYPKSACLGALPPPGGLALKPTYCGYLRSDTPPILDRWDR